MGDFQDNNFIAKIATFFTNEHIKYTNDANLS